MFKYIAPLFILLAAPSYAETPPAVSSIAPSIAPVGQMKAFSMPVVNIDGRVYNVAASLVIFDTSNNIILPNVAPYSWKKIRYQFDTMGQINRIWLLEN